MSQQNEVIEGIKLIYHTGDVDIPDDITYPWKLYAFFSPPEFMIMAFIGLFGGSEEIIVRGVTKEALEQFVESNQLRTHPRLRKLEITNTSLEVSNEQQS